MLEMRVLFFGKVQGVGFRATARKEALKLHLKGVARNLSDGSVEVIAQGSKENLEAFLKSLEAIFAKTHIEKVSSTFKTPIEYFDSFLVL